MDVKQQIDDLMANHDADPAASLARLAALDPSDIEAPDLRRVAWLINHLAGEQLGQWSHAHDLQQRLKRQDAPLQVALHRAVAAQFAAAPLEAWQAERDFLEAARCSEKGTTVVVRLAVLQFAARTHSPLGCTEAFDACLDGLDGLERFDGLEKVVAPLLNNIATALIDRSDAQLDEPAYQTTVMRGARAARAAWLVAGTWVNHERAEYLCALAANAVRDWSAARDAAQRGLDLIAANGQEDVDQAFLALELSRALKGLKADVEAAAAFARASELATAFESQFLIDWFADRVRIAQADHPSDRSTV